jgi:tyrosine-protein phosphatase YwqE
LGQHARTNFRKNQSITVSALEKNTITVPFHAAAEYLMDDQFVQLFQSRSLLTLKDNYVLVEMSYINPPIQLYTILLIWVAGYIPVLAHPERYLFYHNNFNEYQAETLAVLFQLNLLWLQLLRSLSYSKTCTPM